MTEFNVTTACGNQNTFNTKPDAENGRDTHTSLCPTCDTADVEITPTGAPKPDGGEVEVVSRAEDGGLGVEVQEPESGQLPEEKPAVDEDPLNWMPEHFVDQIQGVPTLNRKAYAVLCEQYGVSVTAEPVTLPSESGFEYAEFRAVATTEDGQEYSGFGSAHVDRQDGDDPHLLAELAETRALKRAAAWATGVGITAIEELQGGQA